jgi:serine/threonine-protein kinase
VDAKGRAFIVMEYLQGETLGQRIDRFGGLPWDVACAAGQQIAAAVGAAHGKGIIHRDLKPDNVFLAADPAGSGTTSIKVLDFGIAKLLTGDPLTRASSGGQSLMGTPEYMSPEQCGGAGHVDHRADIYSLGCILFEMVCGQAPFVEAGLREMIAAHLFKSPPLATSVQPGCPAWLAELIERMLAKKATERPSSMKEVERLLGRGLAGSKHLLQTDAEAGEIGPSLTIGRIRIEDGAATWPSRRLGAVLGILIGVGIAAGWGLVRVSARGAVVRAAPKARAVAAAPAVGPVPDPVLARPPAPVVVPSATAAASEDNDDGAPLAPPRAKARRSPKRPTQVRTEMDGIVDL